MFIIIALLPLIVFFFGVWFWSGGIGAILNAGQKHEANPVETAYAQRADHYRRMIYWLELGNSTGAFAQDLKAEYGAFVGDHAARRNATLKTPGDVCTRCGGHVDWGYCLHCGAPAVKAPDAPPMPTPMFDEFGHLDSDEFIIRMREIDPTYSRTTSQEDVQAREAREAYEAWLDAEARQRGSDH